MASHNMEAVDKTSGATRMCSLSLRRSATASAARQGRQLQSWAGLGLVQLLAASSGRRWCLSARACLAERQRPFLLELRWRTSGSFTLRPGQANTDHHN